MGGQSNGDIDKLAILPEDSLEVEKHRRKEKPKMASTWPEMFRAWPKTTFLIVSNEFCERFSFYGMRTVLTLYLLNILKFNDNTSTVFFNAFNVLCYTTPVLGSILADGYIGKFKTIFSVSILYAIGQCVLAGASTQNSKSSLHPWLDFAGLIIIAFGTGGIKPCVSAFGADQFEAHEERMIGMYFSVFYFSINAGSMISTFVSPIFRSLPCLGQDSCYPMAFGIPAALMITATVVFIVGSFWYKKPPPKENVFGEVWRLGSKAVSNKMKSKGAKKEHWLLYYLDTHDCQYDAKCVALQNKKRNKDLCHKRQFVDDVRSLLRVLVMFLPVPIFWAIYDQQGSLWTIQALEMNCRIWGEKDSQYLLLPDQMQTLNAVLILAFIPIFQIIIYPVFSFCIKLTPLRKMVAGGVIAAISMVVTALVQFKINTTLADIPPVGQSYVSFVNGFDDCGMTVTWLNAKNDTHHYIGPREALTNNKNQDLAQLFSVNAGSNTWRIDYNGTCDYSKAPQEVTYKTNSTVIHYVFVSEIGAYIGDTDPAKPTQGNGDFKLGIDLAFSDLDYKGHLALCRAGTKGTDADHPCDPTQPENFYFWEDEKNTAEYNDTAGCGYDDTRGQQNYTQAGGLVYSTYQATQYTFKPVRPGNWSLYYLYNTAKCIGRQSYSIEKVKVRAVGVHIVRYEQGGVYLLVINGKSDNPQVTQFQVGPDNVINILWQVPQIVIITAAEILFSITGYEFAYTQCAPSMKALVQAAWLLTTAAGDTIIALVQLWAPFNNMAIEFLAYAGLMLAVMIIFALMCIFYYEYNYYTGEDAAADDDEEDDDTHTECASEVGKSSRLNSAVGNGTANKAYKAEDDDDDVWNTKF